MFPKWCGPYKIVEKKDKNLFRLCNVSTSITLATLVNARLKVYNEPSVQDPPAKKKKLCVDPQGGKEAKDEKAISNTESLQNEEVSL